LKIEVQLKILRQGKAQLPQYRTSGASGADLYACIDEAVTIMPGDTIAVPTGIALAIPPGFEGQVRARSGLALQHNIGLINAPGTIDSDFRGEVKVLLTNFGKQPYVVQPGERIAQLVIVPVAHADFKIVECLPETKRGEGGFGHTGW